jgi:hypothetical protein
MTIYWIIVSIILISLLVFLIYCNCKENFTNEKTKRPKFKAPPSKTVLEKFVKWVENLTIKSPKFKAPLSLTNVKIPKSSTKVNHTDSDKEIYKTVINNYNKNRKGEKKNTIVKILNDIAHHDEKGFHSVHLNQKIDDNHHYHYEEGNILTFPLFFDCRDKWPGCMPPPLFQGTCGSCWAFAIATCLSARYYIESCGNTGCENYPQINLESVDITLDNINALYKFRKVYLTNIHAYIDVDKNKKLTEKEWLGAIKRAHSDSLKGNGYDKFYAMQILLYMLNYQSLGGIHFNVKNPNLENIISRGKKTFKLWADGDSIDISALEKNWLSQPVPLSAEKIVSCCYPNCYERGSSLFNLSKAEIIKKSTPQCVGGTLVDGWKLVRDTGTTTSFCIGYNLDTWEEGEPTPNCHELQGPDYSYCSGFSIHTDFWGPEMDKVLKDSETHNLDPITVNNSHYEKLPWVNPQLFRFRAKNAYEVADDMKAIQREIIERGPVTSGFAIYEDFQYQFGGDGLGGQLYNGEKPLGGKKDSLIYMWNGKGKQIGGHAITIVGWGTFETLEGNGIPYWICLNSWGIEWGTSGYPAFDNRSGLPDNLKQGGYFWIVRGIDNCGIEKNVVAGQPNLENISYPGTSQRYGWGLPHPRLDQVKLIPAFEDNVLKIGDLEVELGPFIEGAGSYTSNLGHEKWAITGMEPPSPFVLFWPDERPLFCLGEINKDISSSKNDRVVTVSDVTSFKLERLRKIQSHPIVLINDEQFQIVEKINNQTEEKFTLIKTLNHNISDNNKIKTLNQDNYYRYKVNRALDNSTLMEHKTGSKIKIFPYRNLSVEDLKQFPRCDKKYSGNIDELKN